MSVLFYRFIYPKKKVNLFVLLLLISILPIISIFRPGDYESGDFNIHIYRTMDFYKSLSEGILMPSWAGNLNATYGYPLFIFLNPLPYYLQSFFHFIGFSFISSMKVLLASSYFLSGIFFYLWAKREVGNSLAAFSGAIFYLFMPYHFIDLHFRAAIGEVLFFTCLPLFFYCFAKFKEKKNTIWFLISSISFSLMIFSHQALALFSLIIVIPYFYFSVKEGKTKIKTLFIYLIILFLGSVYSFYTWLPHLIYQKYTLAYFLSNKIVSFPNIEDLIFSKWRYGFLFQGPKGELSFLIGYTQILVLISSIILLIRRGVIKSNGQMQLMWTLVSLFVVYMMTPFSSFLWKAIPILNTAQFSTRLLLLLSFTISAISIYLVSIFKKLYVVIYLILAITIGYTILNWGQRRVIPQITDSTLAVNLPKSTSEGEGYCCMAQPKWTLPKAKWMDIIPQKHVEIVKGQGEIIEENRLNNQHNFLTFSNQEVLIKENTWYFPGWKLSIDGKSTNIIYTDKNYPDIMFFQVPKGLHAIKLQYQDLSELFMAKVISILALVISLIGIILLYINSFLRIKIKINGV